jgi:lipoyl(octanoyl) transferase
MPVVIYHETMVETTRPGEATGDTASPGSAPYRPAVWLDAGVLDYATAYQRQLRLHALRLAGDIPDTALVLEHAACITYGRGADRTNILADEERLRAAGVTVYPTDRGGDVTYHGPGQLILYAIVGLEGYGKDVHAHVRRMEQVIIDTLASFDVKATRKKEYPGVWTERGKIGAIGLRVNRWVTLHGVSLNVSPDMTHFSLIVPCGIREHGVVSLGELLGYAVPVGAVKVILRESFERVFDVRLVDAANGQLGM